jgi:hypothetical protein
MVAGISSHVLDNMTVPKAVESDAGYPLFSSFYLGLSAWRWQEKRLVHYQK